MDNYKQVKDQYFQMYSGIRAAAEAAQTPAPATQASGLNKAGWYSGDRPTWREAVGKTYEIYRTDPVKGNELWTGLQTLRSDPSSMFYNAYSQPTNRAASNLAANGFNTELLTNGWLNSSEAAGYIRSNLVYDGATNTPKAPGKKSTADQYNAYWLNQYLTAEKDTNAAQSEIDGSFDFIKYWTGSDQNLSDEQIKQKYKDEYYQKNCKTLQKMQSNADANKPLELNRAMEFTDDTIDAMIWMARNPEYNGSIEGAMVYSYLGEGNTYKENPEITARLTEGSPEYAPYYVGATMGEDLSYFGLYSADQKWVDDNFSRIMAGNDEEAKEHARNIAGGVQYTTKLNSERDEMQKQIDNYIEKGYTNPDFIINKIKENTDAYGDLFALDETMEVGKQYGKLKSTTDKVPYRWQDVENQIRTRCEEENNKRDALSLAENRGYPHSTNPTSQPTIKKASADDVDAVSGAASTAPSGTKKPLFTETDRANEEAFKKDMDAIGATVEAEGTEAEKTAFLSGKSILTGVIRDAISTINTGMETLRDAVNGQIQYEYPETIRTIADYDTHKATRDGYAANLEKVDAELNALKEKEAKTGDMTPELYEKFLQLPNIIESGSIDPYWLKVLERGDSYFQDDYQREKYEQALGVLYSSIDPEGYYNNSNETVLAMGKKMWDLYQETREGSPIDKLEKDANETDDGVDEFSTDIELPKTGGYTGEDEDTALNISFERDDSGKFVFAGAFGNRTGEEYTKKEAEKLLGYEGVKLASQMTAEDYNRMSVLEQSSAELNQKLKDEDEYLSANQGMYDEAMMDKNTILTAAKFTGSTELAETIDNVFELTASSPYANYQYMPYSIYDYLAETGETTKEEAYADAATTAVNSASQLQEIDKALAKITESGIELTDDELAMIQKNRADLQHISLSTGYAGLNNKEGFSKDAEAGKEMAASGEYGQIAKSIASGEWELDTGDYLLGFLGGAGSSDRVLREAGKNEELLLSMSEDEKNRFFYLLKMDGQKAAEDYFKFIADPGNGELTIRASGDVAKRTEEFASQNLFNAALSTVASFVGKRMGNAEATVNRIGSWITGETLSSYNPAFWMSNATSGMRQGAKDWLKTVFGDNTVSDKVYDVLVGIGDYTLASKEIKALGTIFEGSKLAGVIEKAGEWLNGKGKIGQFAVSMVNDAATVLPMSLESWNSTYQSVFAQTKDKDKAEQMAGVAFVADMVSHTVIMNGMRKTFEADPSAFSSKLSAYLYQVFSNSQAIGVSTLVTEKFKDDCERIILDDMSTYNQILKKYQDMNYPDSMAEHYADMEMWGTILGHVADAEINSVIRTTATFGANELIRSEAAQKLRDQFEVIKEYLKPSKPETGFVSAGDWANAPEGFHSIVPDEAIVNPVSADGTVVYDRQTGKPHTVVAFMTTESGNIVFIDSDGEQIPFMNVATQSGHVAGNLTDDEMSLLSYAYQYGKDQFDLNRSNTTSWTYGQNESGEAPAPEETTVSGPGLPSPVYNLPGASEGNDQTTKDLSILSNTYGSTPTASAVGLSAVLNDPDPNTSTASGQNLVALAGDAKAAIATVQQLIANTPNPAETKNDTVIASLVSGAGKDALKGIIEKVKAGEEITAEDVNALHNGVEQDNADPDNLKSLLDAAVKENRIANLTNRILTLPANKNRIETAEANAADKKRNADAANDYMIQKQNEAQAAADNLMSAEANYNPEEDTQTGGPLQQQTEKLLGADTAATQAEDSYKQQQQIAEEAQKKLDDIRNEVTTSARQEATVQVEQEMADEQALLDQQAQQKAEAEQQYQDLMIQEANAEAAERDSYLNTVKTELANIGYTGDIDKQAERIVERRMMLKRGEVNTDSLISEEDGDAFLRTVSRQTGITFTQKDMGNPLVFRGMITDRNNIILNSNLSKGQALTEAALHEVLHGLGDTGAYQPFSEVALKILFGNDTDAYNRAVLNKIREYASVGEQLTIDGAKEEIVADYARLNMANKKFVRKVVARGAGDDARNAIGKSLSLLKGYKFNGPARRQVNNFKKAERLYIEAIDERARMVKEGYKGHTGMSQFSITSAAQAAGLTVEVTDDDNYRYKLYDADGNELAPGGYTPEMVNGTPVGKVINLAEKYSTAPNKAEIADTQRKFVSDIINMIGQYQDAAMVWELAGSLAFSTLKTNGDPQYTDSEDMGTICTKTQAILNVISETQVRLGRGLTKKEIDGIVYNEVGKGVQDENGKWKHGATPCPPCYVYATWVNKPARLEKIRQYQEKFKDWTDEQINEFMNAPAPSSKKAATERNSQKLWINTCLADEHKDPVTGESTWTRKENPSICPDDILLDLRRSGDMATQYPGTWRFMQKGGNAQGKAIAPYSDSRLGETIIGKAIGAGELNARLLTDAQNEGNPDYIPQFVNPFLTGDDAKAEEYFQKALTKAKAQNLKGGQRWQSWSDARAEWGSDYLMEMLTMQALGAQVQTYTKVPEMLPLLASAGFEVNMSLMPEGDGFAHNEDGSIKTDEDGNPVLAFSKVTGINPEAAEAFAKQYGEKGNVQPMVVGISDDHIKAALSGDYITFVIPFHGSGGSVKRLQHLMSLLHEKMDSGNDYTKAQSDKFISGETNTNPNWMLREAIITGNYDSLNDKQKDTIDDNEYLSKLYEDRYLNEDSPAYHVFFSKGEAQQIYPYEYWDTNTTLATADENSKRFINYCNLLGVIPRFSGLQKKNGTEYANFSGAERDENGNIIGYNPVPGYWKLLIDRPMYKRIYDESGKLIKDQCAYRDPEVVDVGNIEVTAMPMSANNTVGHSDDETRAITDRVIQQILLNKGPATSAYSGGMTLGNAPSEMIDNEAIIKKAMYADSNVQLSAGGDLSDEEIDQVIEKIDKRTELEKITGKPLSKELIDVKDRYMSGEDVPLEEALAVPEIAFLRSTARPGYSINTDLIKAYKNKSENWIDEVLSRLPAEQVEQMTKLKAELDNQGSVSSITPEGKAKRGGEIVQGRRVDFIIGLAAAGKSSIADYISYKYHSGFVDSDDYKTIHPDYDNGRGTTYVHPESGFVNSWRIKEAIERGDNLVFPTVGDDKKGLYNKLIPFIDNGYDVHLHMIDLPQAKAIGRSIGRTISTGRYIDIPLLKSMDPVSIASSFDKFKGDEIISGYAKWNNDVPLGEHPRVIEQSDGDETDLFNIGGGRETGNGRFSVVPNPSQEGETVNGDGPSIGFDNGSRPGGLTENGTINNDGAFSIGGDLSDTEMDQLLVQSGLITPEMIPYSYVPSTNVRNDNGTRFRQFGRQTAQESNALHDQVKEYLYNNSSYLPDTNAEQIDRALGWVRDHATEKDPDGYYASLKEVMDPDFNYRTADGQAEMLAVMGMAVLKAEAGDERALQDEIDLADAYNKQGTDLGQALQARKLFRLMTPIGRKALLQREADRINQNLADLGKKYRVTIPDELLEEGANAKTEKEFSEAKRKIRNALNEQIPVTWGERIIGWRMLSMLSAPKTHFRNVIGNTLFMPVVGIKNKIGAAIELGAQKAGKIDKSERTKTIGISNPESRKFASTRAVEIEDILRGNAKYGEGDQRQQKRKIFGTKDNVISKTFGKALQWWYDANGKALEWEDWLFLKGHFTRALGGYMTARGLKPEDMNGTVLEEAELYAIQEAHKATYRDDSGVANWMNKIGSKKTNADNNKALSVIQWIVNTRFPFKRTPINIAKRGIEYSPVGLGKSLTYDLAHLKQYLDANNGKLEKMPKSAISPTEWIDKFSAGLTGTGIMIAGIVASALGIARAGLDKKDPEDQIAKMAGEKEYSIRPGKLTDLELIDEDVSMTLDWAAPVVLPFFTGVGLKEYYEKKGFSVGGILDLVMEVTEPMMNMSFMSGVSDMFKNNGYSTKDGFWQFIEKTGINFATSLIPTWSGQLSNIASGSKTTFSGGESLTGDPDIDKMIQQIGNKLSWLGLDFGGVPYTNTLGEEQEPVIASWAEQLVSPAYFSRVDESDEMKELARLYLLDPDENKAIIPSEPDKIINVDKQKIQLNGKQYTKLKADHGAVWRETTQKLVNNPLYEMASDGSKAAMYDLADTYATQVAKYMTNNKYKMDSWIENAYRIGNADDVIVNKVAAKNKQVYVESQAKYFAEALMTNNAKDIKKYADELTESKADPSEVRKQLTAYYKPLYKEAYRQGDDTTMLQIEYILSTVNDYLSLDKPITKYTTKKDFDKWITSTDTVTDYEDEDENDWLNSDRTGSFSPNGRMIASAGMSDSSFSNRTVSMPERPASDNSWDQYMSDLDDYWADYDFASNDPVGQYGQGNIDLDNRQTVQNDDGSISTEQSFSFYDEQTGKEVLIPLIADGRVMTQDEAIDRYYETGEYLGMFDDWHDADEYATMLHNRQDWYYHQ